MAGWAWRVPISHRPHHLSVAGVGCWVCCACLLPIGAGVFAANSYVAKCADARVNRRWRDARGHRRRFGGLIYLIIGVPARILYQARRPSSADGTVAAADGIDLGGGFALAIVGGIIGVIVYTILSPIGGLICVAIFESARAPRRSVAASSATELRRAGGQLRPSGLK